MTGVRGGLVVRFDAQAADAVGLASLAFLPASVARRVGVTSAIVTLGGSPPVRLGLAVVDGRLLTLLAIGPVEAHGPAVICDRPGAEPLALAVAAVVASGVFDAVDDGVHVPGGVAPEMHLAPLLDRIEAAVWVQRAGRAPSSAPPPSSRSPVMRTR